jgi:hypothetical protein
MGMDGEEGWGPGRGRVGYFLFWLQNSLVPGGNTHPRLKTPLVPVHSPRTKGGGLLSLIISPG